MSTGLYRVYDIKRNGKTSHYEYRVKNKLLDKVIANKDIVMLKMKVQEAGLLWGITDVEEATKLAQKHDIHPRVLQGQYGQQINN